MSGYVPGMGPGRIVHYVAYGTPGGEYEPGAHRAAIITGVVDATKGLADLCVFNPTGLHFVQASSHAHPPQAGTFTKPEPGTWHFPEYVA